MCWDAKRVYLQFRYTYYHVRVRVFVCVLSCVYDSMCIVLCITMLMFFLGPVCSILVECFGCRATIMVGGILSGLGMVVSSFAQTMADLYIATGVITGESRI